MSDDLARSALSRRVFTGGLAGLGAAALTAGPAVAGPRPPSADQARWARRAAVSWAALKRSFAIDDGSNLLHEAVPVGDDDPTYSYEWPFSQAHIAAADLTQMVVGGHRFRDDLTRLDRGQQHYWDEEGSTGLPGFASAPLAPYGGGGDFFYDDNEWVGLLDVQRRLTDGDRRAQREAEKIFDLVVSGWDDDDSHAAPGGVFWTQGSIRDRNTVSNMPGAELGLRLYQLTRRPYYLRWSLKMYRWTNRHLQRPGGLYDDHLGLDGTLETTVWSYNQGVPVGVNVLLHKVTGDRAYLKEANRIARATEDFYGDRELDAQPAFFNSIYFKNLLLLDAANHDHHHRDRMARYADRTWRTKRDADTGLFHFGADGRTQLLEQAAMVQVFAVLAWPRSRHTRLY